MIYRYTERRADANAQHVRTHHWRNMFLILKGEVINCCHFLTDLLLQIVYFGWIYVGNSFTYSVFRTVGSKYYRNYHLSYVYFTSLCPTEEQNWTYLATNFVFFFFYKKIFNSRLHFGGTDLRSFNTFAHHVLGPRRIRRRDNLVYLLEPGVVALLTEVCIVVSSWR